MQAVEQLYELQEVDLEIRAIEKELAEVRTRLADDSALTAARKRVEQLEAQIEDLSSRHRAMERTIEETQERLQKIEARLYGGAVTELRELSAAQEERDFTLQQRREQEDTLLELMVEMEDVQATQGEAGETLARLEADGPAEEADLLKRDERLSGEITRLSEDRTQIVTLVPAELRSLYERLRKSTNGTAVAKVERGMCQGCRLALSTMELQRARGAQGVTQCSSCRRILYVV